ncbi:VacB/RNase II family 3'-5' exoribonuclease [Bacterioplanes sanyensis]|nr:VacB/RNase II family 3'-5' exoribonuclease [Bacterioplanes sanyensis]
MLDQNALSQLKSLKQELHDSTPRFQGRVRATSGRFGFVNTDDGQQFFLPPDEMEKVLPGDVIDFRVETTSEGKQQAAIEKLVSTELDGFFGRYVVRGKGHFIEPDHGGLNRWIFVPPAKRQGCEDGDLVFARMSQHPFPKGRAQANIEERIGAAQGGSIEHDYIQRKFNLSAEFADAVKNEVAQLTEQGLDELLPQREDFTHLPFVTIDSAGTRDLDDALYAEAHSQGWTLWVAIADPAAVIKPGSELDKVAAQRATSAYFPQQVLPMLPAELSEQLCSLVEGSERAALVVELRIDDSGAIENTHLYQGRIRNHAKLAYSQVAQLIAGEDTDISAELHGHLLHLHSCAKALANYRQQNCLVMEERPDYKLLFDEEGQIRDIVRLERSDAHRLVEECMLAANRAIADWLAQHEHGIYIGHTGIRTERLGEVTSLLKEHLQLEQKPELQQLQQYVQQLQAAANHDGELPLRTIVSRQLERSAFTTTDTPHFGLGFQRYTTATSPLRKYNDLMVHRLIDDLLHQRPVSLPTSDTLELVQQQQNNARTAAGQTEHWLKLRWLAAQPQDAVLDATILHMNASNFTVRLDDTGIEGTIDRRKQRKEWTFDTKTLSHYKDDQRFVLGQAVKVRIHQLDADKRQIQFALAN